MSNIPSPNTELRDQQDQYKQIIIQEKYREEIAEKKLTAKFKLYNNEEYEG